VALVGKRSEKKIGGEKIGVEIWQKNKRQKVPLFFFLISDSLSINFFLFIKHLYYSTKIKTYRKRKKIKNLNFLGYNYIFLYFYLIYIHHFLSLYIYIYNPTPRYFFYFCESYKLAN
jgi:hypothetical protein